MQIHEMTSEECGAALARASIARLACALDNQPYVLPVHIAYDGGFLYVLSTFGQKIKWMRQNPKVCVQADEVAGESQWTSVIANGAYEELPEPRFKAEREHARKLLGQRFHWWQNALGERQLKSGDALIEPIFFRIRVDSMSGLRATP